MASAAGPNIITDGLVLHLDAANTNSYPGSGTTWTDISGKGNNGTLTNGPTFSSDDGGSIDLDGSDDCTTISSSNDFAYGTGDFTWEVWARADGFGSNNYLLEHGSNGGTLAFGAPGNRYYNSTVGSGSVLYSTGFGSMSSNVWYHLVATRISGTTFLYKNTVLTASASDSHNFAAQSVLLGKYGGSNSNYWNGKISNVKIYKGKGLTATEVKQNYKALRGRYGI